MKLKKKKLASYKDGYLIKPIEGHPGYEIDTDGNIWSFWRRGSHPQLLLNKRLLAFSAQAGRYTRVNLKSKHGKHTISLHKVVLETFVEKREGRQCRHLDGEKSNNRLSNLRWGTAEENYADKILHGVDNGGVRHARAKLNPHKIHLARLLHIDFNWSHKKIARLFNVARSTIQMALSGNTWSS